MKKNVENRFVSQTKLARPVDTDEHKSSIIDLFTNHKRC